MTGEEGGDPESVVDPKTGIMTSEPERVMEILGEAIKKKVGTKEEEMKEYPEYQTRWEEENKWLEGTFPELLKVVTKEEIRRILAKASYSTAAGADGVTIGLLKAAVTHAPEQDETVLDIITMVAQAAIDAEGELEIHREGLVKVLWKKAGLRTVKNIRPITLLNVLGKIPSKVIADRLTKELCDRHLLSPANEGFLLERGTENAIVTLLNLYEDAKQNNKALYNALFDVSGAFDAIPHETIKRGMKILHLPQAIQNYIMRKLEHSTCSIKTKYGRTKAFDIKKGVLQGCPLSPIVYIIAMNPLHVGMSANPKHGYINDGYIITNRENGEETQVGSKGYADDTGAVTKTWKGMERMMDWVNEFCIVNRISMDEKKSLLFGIDKKGRDVRKTIQIVQQGRVDGPQETHRVIERHGATHTLVTVHPIEADADIIKYLGIYMNPELDWTKQLAVMNRTVGHHVHLAKANGLTAEMTVFLFNNYLKAKLSYRMKVTKVPEATLRTWGQKLTKTVADKIHQRVRVKNDALELIMGLELPSIYYKTQNAVMASRALNDNTQMGATTRARLQEEQGRGENAAHRWSEITEELGFPIQRNDKYGQQLPRKLNEWTQRRTITLDGEDWRLPQDHTGTWGHDMPKRKVVMYTDGSLQKTKDGETGEIKQKGGWGMLIREDWMQNNWEKIHEDNLEQYRKNEITDKARYWGKHMDRADSSYQTELSAGIKGLMIIPASWDVDWVTDSESSKKTSESKEAKTATDQTEWQLKQLLHKVQQERTGKLRVIHQHSHKKLQTEHSVGNAAADVVADIFTKERAQQRGTEDLPLGYNNQRYMYRDVKEEGWLRAPIRKRLRQVRRKQLDKEWKETGSQDRVKKQIGLLEPLLKKFTRRKKENQLTKDLAALTRAITEVHNQVPKYEGRFDRTNNCEYCKQKTGELKENTVDHEMVCRFNENKKTKCVDRCTEKAILQAKLGNKQQEKRGQEGVHPKEADDLMLTNKFKETKGKIFLTWMGKETAAPNQTTLQRLTDNFIKCQKEEERKGPQYRRAIFKAVDEANKAKPRTLRSGKITWKMVREVMGCDIQIGTRAANAAEDIWEFTSDRGEEEEIGAKDPHNFEQTSPAAEVTDEDLEEHISYMDGELRKKKNTWSTILTRPKRQNRKQLEEAGYRRIATTGKHTRRVDVHLKLGHGGKIGEQEVLVRLEALRNFGKIGFNEVDSQAFITMTAENPWKEGETEKLRTKLITEAMRWIETPTAAKGVMTEEQIQYMVDRGITRKTAAKIVKETTEELFEEYVQDEYSKKNYCKKKIEQAAREKEKQWKEKLRKEKEQQKETKEQEKKEADKEKRRKKEDKQKEKQLENEQRKEKRRN
jgi:hypothetical protein